MDILNLVLNLIITGIPSILKNIRTAIEYKKVLNLIITGIPSILSHSGQLERF